MNRNMIYETLQKIIESQRKEPMETYLDETDGKIKSKPLSKDSAGSSYNIKQVNEAKLIFGY
jgi:uncharacterized protein YeeX (DUF496 family)